MATTSSKPSKVENIVYKTDVTTNTDGSLKSTTFKTDPNGALVAVSTLNTKKDGTSTRIIEPGASAVEETAFNNKDSPQIKAVNAQIIDAKPYGPNPTVEQQRQLNAATGNQNVATTSPSADGSQGSTPDPAAAAATQEENKYKENTRAGDSAYGTDLKYPLNLKSEVQDVIKFSILEYSPSLAKENQSGTGAQFGSGKKRIVTLESSGIPIVAGSKRIGVITLPIPAGISDGNTVGWQDDQLTAVGQALGEIAAGFLGEEGVGGGVAATGNVAERTQKGAGDVSSLVRNMFIDKAANANVASRIYGATANNNLELLFSNPNLRSFNFTFSFYPRGENEAVMVRRIIRAFKQSMSVKRSKTSLLLKAPHTFAISYVTAGGKAQPYLNSFKECALTSCTVDYTPDGTYMTYGGKEKSMTAYRLSLQFQELEPIFDDEYFDIDKNKDTSIGF
jgi:hypothetical protein